jgi:hypothetical protein
LPQQFTTQQLVLHGLSSVVLQWAFSGLKRSEATDEEDEFITANGTDFLGEELAHYN